MKRNFLIGLVALLLIVFFVPIKVGYRSAREFSTDPNCFDVKRPRYFNRHFSWSGIFPVEGGFIPDPHFICSKTTIIPSTINELLNLIDGKYQIIDINPFFKDKSKKTVLVLGDLNKIWEFNLEDPMVNGETMGGISTYLFNPLKTGFKTICVVFKFEKKLGVYTDFTGSIPGFYIIDVPLREGGISEFYDLKTPQAQEMIPYLKKAYPDIKLKIKEL